MIPSRGTHDLWSGPRINEYRGSFTRPSLSPGQRMPPPPAGEAWPRLLGWMTKDLVAFAEYVDRLIGSVQSELLALPEDKKRRRKRGDGLAEALCSFAIEWRRWFAADPLEERPLPCIAERRPGALFAMNLVRLAKEAVRSRRGRRRMHRLPETPGVGDPALARAVSRYRTVKDWEFHEAASGFFEELHGSLAILPNAAREWILWAPRHSEVVALMTVRDEKPRVRKTRGGRWAWVDGPWSSWTRRAQEVMQIVHDNPGCTNPDIAMKASTFRGEGRPRAKDIAPYTRVLALKKFLHGASGGGWREVKWPPGTKEEDKTMKRSTPTAHGRTT